MPVPSPESLLGRALRLPLRVIPAGIPLPIASGPLRGQRWQTGCLSHGALLGKYEPETQRQLAALVRPGHVVYDLGANAGYHTLLAARLAGARGAVVALEPDPRNVRVLREHLRLNRIANVTVIESAAAERPGRARFRLLENRGMGHLATGGDPHGEEVDVEVVSLDSLVESGRVPPPNVIKMDVEGAESQVLLGARRVLASARPSIVFAVHHADTGEGWTVLRELGYVVESYDPAGGNYVARPG